MPSHTTLPETAGGLYIIWLSDTHFYGGRATNFKGRWGKHLRSLEEGKHVNSHAQHTFNLHHRFEAKILEVIPDKGQRVLTEQIWLDEYWGKPGCLNISKRADGGGHSEETRKKMSETRKGMRHTEESKKKQSALKKLWHTQNLCPVAGLVWVHKGEDRAMVQPEEAKRLVSLEGWILGQAGTGMTGHTHSEQTKQKMRDGSNVGWVWVHDKTTLERKVVRPEGVEEALGAGWAAGMGEFGSWIISQTGEMKRVPDKDLLSWAQRGWVEGRAKGWNHSPRTREKMSKTRAGTKWVCKEGLTSKRVAEEEVPGLLAGGWSPGKGRHKPRSISSPVLLATADVTS